MERYAIYTRVSGQKQDDNFSRRIQIETCERYGDLKGWTQYGHYHDTQSGKDYLERTQVKAILDLLKTAQIQHVIFPVIDRIGRDMHVIESFIKDIYQLSGKVSVASSGATYETADECITDNFFEIAVSDYERRKIKKRTGDGRLRSFMLGSYAKRPPYGYITHQVTQNYEGKQEKFKELRIKESDAKSIVTILTIFADTRSKAATLREINAMALAYDGQPREHWHYSTVAKVIADAELYAGIPQRIYLYDADYVKKNGIAENPAIDYEYPQIIEPELAKRVRIAATLNDNPHRERVADRPLAGLVYCYCGRKAVYFSHDTLALSKFMCSSGAQHKQAKGIGAKQYNPNPCKHGISPVIFIRTLDRFLDTLHETEWISTVGLKFHETYEESQLS